MTSKDGLYQRYMAADRAQREHADGCTTCTPQSRCATGDRLYATFSQLQDAYLKRPGNKT
ncbi:hypothetical protein AB0919_23160 [Streptomyces sp. NPDC046994]|uniref:hypothetical protein n=1 Tax=Streptomyces sp. NPDC046994 TaxID=3155735 RepID=UPI0034522FBB